MSDTGSIDLEIMRKGAADAVSFLKKFSNEDRLLLLCHLTKGEFSVGRLEALTGIQQPTLSQQLGVLREEGLVKTRREGRHIYYSLSDDRVIALLERVYDLFCPF